MSGVDEMMARLKQQLDDDEAYARNAFGEHNEAVPEWTEIWSGAVQVGPNEDLILTSDSPISRHMVRHDPARVLREVDALRRMVTVFEAFDAMAAEAAAKLDAGNEAVHADWLTACTRAGALKDALIALARARYPDCPEWTP